MLEQKLREIEASERSPAIYDTPSWAYLQAHNNGVRQALKQILELLTLDKEVNDHIV